LLNRTYETYSVSEEKYAYFNTFYPQNDDFIVV